MGRAYRCPSPGAARHPLPYGEGRVLVSLLHEGEGAPKGRMRVDSGRFGPISIRYNALTTSPVRDASVLSIPAATESGTAGCGRVRRRPPLQLREADAAPAPLNRRPSGD